MLRVLSIEISKAILDNRFSVMVEHSASQPTVVKYRVFIDQEKDPQ